MNKILDYDKLIPGRVPKDDITYQLLKECLLDKDIKNIGITGSYGSGKSTLIESVNVDDEIKKIKSISISLLNFSNNHINKCETLELEKRILQQIFYQTNQKKIPLSKFHKIENTSKTFNNFLLIFMLGITFILSFLLKETYYADIKNLLSSNKLIDFLSYKYLFCLILFFIICFLSSKILNKLQFIKIKNFSPINSLQFESTKDKEYLDLYMEDIIYCFENLKIKILYIEDLDRCKNIEIFIKLRELNTILNNKIKNSPITFVYAVKDDLFSDNQRSKFFDFIIPVIPALNSYNSEGILRKKLESDFFTDKDSIFLSEIFRYITDMRLGLNICNEYKIYKEKLNSSFIENSNLLSIIVYKNLYPSEFSKSNFNIGFLYRVFNINKKKLVDSQIKKIENNISQLESEILKIEERKTSDKAFLDDILKNIILKGIVENKGNFSGIKNVEILLEENIKSNYQAIRYGNWTVVDEILNYEDIKIIDYKSEIVLIEKNKKNEISNINKKIEQLLLEKNEIQNKSLANLLKESSLEDHHKILELNSNSQKRNNKSDKVEHLNYEYSLKLFLFSNGYINENYQNFLSEFKAGELSYQDNSFIKAVFANFSSEQTLIMFIDTPQKVLEKISTLNNYNIINIYLINYSLNNNFKNDSFYLNKIFNLINFDTELDRNNFLFILSFIDYKEIFLTGIIRSNKNLWNNIITEYPSHTVDSIIETIFNNFSEEGIINFDIDSDHTFSKYLEKHKDIFSLNLNINNFETLLIKTNIKFNNISRTKKEEIFELIKKYNAYNLNRENIENFFYLDTNTNIEKGRFYTDIFVTSISNYIKEDLTFFITNIYLNLKDYSKEDEQLLIELINNETIDDKLKEKILELDLNLFKNIEVFPNFLYNSLIKNRKIEKSSSNINKVATMNSIWVTDVISPFINNKIPLIKDSAINDELIDFIISKKTLDEISLYSLKEIISSNDNYIFNANEEIIKNIELEKLMFLIKEKKIKFNQNILPYLNSSLLSDYISNNQDIILSLQENSELKIEIFNEETLILILEKCQEIINLLSPQDITLITSKLKTKMLKKETLEKIVIKFMEKSINLLIIQTKFYKKNIFEFLEIVDYKFKNNKFVILNNGVFWEALANTLIEHNLLTSFKIDSNNRIRMTKIAFKI